MTTLRADGTPICGAKTRAGTPCKGLPMPNGRCRLHGGKTPSGVASSAFVHGRYSKYLPSRMMARYHEAEADTELLNLTAEVSLIDARLADLLSRADKADPGKALEEARRANLEIQKAIHDENYGRMLIMALELDRVINDAQDDHHVWDEIQTLIEQRRKLVESERKRLVEMQQMVSASSAMTLATALLEAVRRNVTDRAVLSAVQADFNRLVNLEQTKADA